MMQLCLQRSELLRIKVQTSGECQGCGKLNRDRQSTMTLNLKDALVKAQESNKGTK